MVTQHDIIITIEMVLDLMNQDNEPLHLVQGKHHQYQEVIMQTDIERDKKEKGEIERTMKDNADNNRIEIYLDNQKDRDEIIQIGYPLEVVYQVGGLEDFSDLVREYKKIVITEIIKIGHLGEEIDDKGGLEVFSGVALV